MVGAIISLHPKTNLFFLTDSVLGKEVEGGYEDDSHVLRHPQCFVGRQFMHTQFALAQARLHHTLTRYSTAAGFELGGFLGLS